MKCTYGQGVFLQIWNCLDAATKHYKFTNKCTPAMEGLLSAHQSLLPLHDVVYTQRDEKQSMYDGLAHNFMCTNLQTSCRFEVYVCTTGEREYAQEVWRLLDPHGDVIHESDYPTRIVCVDPDHDKSLLR